MSLRDYTDEELLSEVAQRRSAREKRLKTMRKEHYEKYCSKCEHNYDGPGFSNGFCSECGIDTHDITGCGFFKEKAK